MKRQNVASIVIVSALAVVGVVVAAQDRYALKSANGIAFSEFRGYDAWQVIAVSLAPEGDGCGTSKDGCIKAILGNPTMVKAYSEGIPANGKPVPDGAALAKVEWLKKQNPASPYDVTVPGAQTEVAFMVKDSKRFPGTNGWGYATLSFDAASDTYKPKTIETSAMRKLCHDCHTTGAKERDYVYSSYARR